MVLCLPSMHTTLVPHKLDVVAHTSNPSTWKVGEDQGFKVILSYLNISCTWATGDLAPINKKTSETIKTKFDHPLNNSYWKGKVTKKQTLFC